MPPASTNGWGRHVASKLTEHDMRLQALEQRATKHGSEIDTLTKDAAKPSAWASTWQEVIREVVKRLPWEKAGYGLAILALLISQGSPEARAILLKMLGAG